MERISQTPLEAAQLVMMDILNVIHQICERNDINYWLSDGTLLGSVRHEGFIPWDDDADISMLREDYNKFIRIVQNELPEPYKVQSVEHQTHGLHNWCKIMYMDDFEWIDWHGNWTKGLSVDIFPFDYVRNENVEALSLTEKLVNRVACIRYPLKGNSVKALLQRRIQRLKIHNHYNKFNKKTEIVTYGIETPYYGYAYFNIQDIFPLDKGKFGDYNFYIPKNYDRYLTIEYGNYMEIPEKEKQVSHMTNLRFVNKK